MNEIYNKKVNQLKMIISNYQNYKGQKTDFEKSLQQHKNISEQERQELSILHYDSIEEIIHILASSRKVFVFLDKDMSNAECAKIFEE